MKLKCNKHERRVMVLNKTTVHREDSSLCDSDVLHIGDTETTPDNAREFWNKIPTSLFEVLGIE